MGIKELMIGDRVLTPKGDVVKIVKVDDGGLIDVEFKDYVRKSILVTDLTPIPFVLRTLFLNGFVLISAELDCYHYAHKEGKIYVDYSKDDDGLYFDSPTPIKISYVHQFQHLLRLYDLYELADNLKE